MSLSLSFFSLVVVLLLEQLRPLPVRQVVLEPLRSLTGYLLKSLDSGHKYREQLVWGLLVLGGVVLCALVSRLLSPFLGVLFSILVLYLTLGFRHESHYFTDIHLALRAGEIDRARALLAEWRGGWYDGVGSDGIARLAIEQALVGAHRNVLGVVFWFLVLGPCGAVMYRLTRFLHDEWWGTEPVREGDAGSVLGAEASVSVQAAGDGEKRHGEFSRHAFLILDWVPSRITAVLFAIGGNFEDAVFCWRSQAVLWPDRANAVLVTSGAGALGVRLGESDSTESGAAPEIGVGAKAGVDDLQAAVGLVWRALIVYLMLLALTTVAVWVGN